MLIFIGGVMLMMLLRESFRRRFQVSKIENQFPKTFREKVEIWPKLKYLFSIIFFSSFFAFFDRNRFQLQKNSFLVLQNNLKKIIFFENDEECWGGRRGQFFVFVSGSERHIVRLKRKILFITNEELNSLAYCQSIQLFKKR